MGEIREKRYLIEKYRDEYNTLHQAIEINLFKNDLSNGKELLFLRSTINPNLTILYEQIYLDKNREVLKVERLVNNEWIKIK